MLLLSFGEAQNFLLKKKTPRFRIQQTRTQSLFRIQAAQPDSTISEANYNLDLLKPGI